MSTNPLFGPELRRLRQEARLTLTEFSVALNYDKGHLSKVERGERTASPDLARRCDAFLGANGELQSLVVRPETDADTTQSPAVPSLWLVGRRAVLAAGTGALSDLSLKLGGQASSAADPLLPSFRAQFDQLRNLGQSTAPKILLPLLETQTRMVAGLAAGAPSATRTPALLLASRFAEFTWCWMAQEAGDWGAALGWTGEAAELARAGGDPYLGPYALVRRALVTLYGGDAAGTVALADRAQSDGLPPRTGTCAPAGGAGTRARRRRTCLPAQPRPGTGAARQRRRPQRRRARDRHHPCERSGSDDDRLVPARPRSSQGRRRDPRPGVPPPPASRAANPYPVRLSQVLGPRRLRRGRARVRDRRGTPGGDAGRAFGNGGERRPASRAGTLPVPEQPGRQ